MTFTIWQNLDCHEISDDDVIHEFDAVDDSNQICIFDEIRDDDVIHDCTQLTILGF